MTPRRALSFRSHGNQRHWSRPYAYLPVNPCDRTDTGADTMPASPRANRASELGRAVRLHRRALGLTQEEMARYAGCGDAFVYALEKGKPTVRLDKLLDVLEVL